MQTHPYSGVQFVQKAVNFEVEDVDIASGIIVAYGSKFDNIDRDGDMFIRGAYAETIRERGPNGSDEIKHLLQHNSHQPLGKMLSLKEDAFGLKFESQATMGIDYVDATLRFYEAGVYKNHSVGFQFIDFEFINDDDQKGPHWVISKVKLWEISTVTWGANPQTPFIGFKSGNKASIDIYFNELFARISGCRTAVKGTMTDECAKIIEMEMMKLESELRMAVQAIKEISFSKKITKPNPDKFDPVAFIDKYPIT